MTDGINSGTLTGNSEIPKILSPIVRVTKAVCDYYGQPLEVILGPKRHADFVRCRDLSIWTTKQVIPNSSYSALARRFNRDHTTIISSYRRVESRMAVDAGYRHEAEKLVELCRPLAPTTGGQQ
jgi:chromosomal replication initiation ATPase DnaA